MFGLYRPKILWMAVWIPLVTGCANNPDFEMHAEDAGAINLLMSKTFGGRIEAVTSHFKKELLLLHGREVQGGIWNLNTGKQLSSFPDYQYVFSAGFLPNGMRLLTAEQAGGGMWSIEPFERINKFDVESDQLSISPNGTFVAFAQSGYDSWRISVWDLESTSEVYAFAFEKDRVDLNLSVGCCSFSPSESHFVIGDPAGTIYIVETGTWEIAKEMKAGDFPILGFVFPVDDSRFSSLDSHSSLKQWDTVEGALIKESSLGFTNEPEKLSIYGGIIVAVVEGDMLTMIDAEKSRVVLFEEFPVSPDRIHCTMISGKEACLATVRNLFPHRSIVEVWGISLSGM